MRGTKMREVVLLVPSHVSNENIFLKVKGPMGVEYVQPYIVPERVGRRDTEEVEALTGAKYISPAPPSREEFETLCSRVEKLERESERQCARVIKMEEGISDDLK